MRYVILLLLYGCSYTSTTELEVQLMACFNDHAQGCELISDELDRREEARKRKENRPECAVNAKCYYPDERGWRW